MNRFTSPHGAGVVETALGVGRRRAGWGASVAGLVFAVAVAVVFLSRPVYRAEALLRLGDPPPTAGITPTGGLLSFLRTGGDPFANDLELLASRTVAQEVVRSTALSVKLQAPRGWYRDSVFVALTLQDTTAKAVFEVRWTGADRVAVRQLSPERREEGEFRAGESAVFGGMNATFGERRPGGPATVRLRTIPFGDAVRSASGRTSVTRTRRDANVLRIAFTHEDPGVALAVVQAVVQDFLRLRTRLFQRESGETVDSLRAVALTTREELRTAEDALESFQEATGLVALDPQSEALVERYEAVRTALEEATAEREALDAQLGRVTDLTDPVRSWSVLVAYPRFLDNQTVGDFFTRLTELHARRTEAASRLQPGALEMTTLDEQIRQLDGALRTLVAEYRTSVSQSIRELEARAASLEAVMARLPAQLVELGRRQRDVRVLSEIVVVTEQRLRQEELRQALAFSNVQVIDEPGLRFRPVWPRKKLGLGVGLLLALGAGVLGMAMVERADATVRSAARIRVLTGAPVLASPVGAAGAAALSSEEAEAVRAALGSGTMVLCEGLRDEEAKGLDPRLAGEQGGGLRRVQGFAAAAAVVGPTVLVVRVGRTPERDLASAALLLREAGLDVAGTIAVCSSREEVKGLWR